MFKEPVAWWVLFEPLREERHPLEQPAANRQMKHAAERRCFAIDRRRFEALFAAMELVAPHAVGRHYPSGRATEEAAQMLDARARRRERAVALELVVL